MLDAEGALKRLRGGNERFCSGRRLDEADRSLPAEVADGQWPFAILLGCSDSRVPAELVFDQGLGDLFVVRVAGNVVAPSQIASIEFAASQFGTPLVVVLGHSRCGAVAATLEQLRLPQSQRAGTLKAIVDRIAPAVQSLLAAPELADADEGRISELAVRANTLASVDKVRHGSPIIEELILAGKLKVVGAEYGLDTGRVDWFDD